MKISVLLAALLLLFSCTDKDSKQSQDLIVKTAQAVSASGIKTTEFPFIAQPFIQLLYPLKFSFSLVIDGFSPFFANMEITRIYFSNNTALFVMVTGIYPRM